MDRRRILVLLGLACLVAPGGAHAAPIQYDGSRLNILVFTTPRIEEADVFQVDEEIETSEGRRARVRVESRPDRIDIIGDTDSGQVLYDVEFTLTRSVDYVLSTTMAQTDDSTALIELERLGPNYERLLRYSGGLFFPEDVTTTGTLTPDRYRLSLSAGPAFDGFVFTNFDISFVVPEPGTGLLLASGLIGLAARSRRGRRPSVSPTSCQR